MDLKVEKPIQTVLSKLGSWVDSFVAMVPNLVVAILLLIVFVVLAKVAKNLFKKLISKATDNKVLEDLFGTIVYFLVMGLGLFIILGILGLEKTVTSLLAGVGVIGLALGFAFQDISANFISGMILAFKTPFKVGDIVDLNGIMGKVARANLRVTALHTFQGQEVYIPNKDVLQNPIYNYTVLGKRRIDLSVGVSYSDDLAKVESLVKETITSMDGVIDHDKLVFDYYEFGSSSINFMIRFWIEFPGTSPLNSYLVVRNQAIMNIKKAFDKNGITIPFPIRTLEFSGKSKTSTINVKSLSLKDEGESDS